MNFDLLKVEKEDTSTNNLQRKLNKKIRHLKGKQPHGLNLKKIRELEEQLNYLNPVKPNIPKKDKISSDKLLEQEYKKNSPFWIKRDEKFKREEKERHKKEYYRKQMLLQKKQSVKISTNRYETIINKYTNSKLIKELNEPNIKLIKNNIMILGMSLNNYKISIPDDIINHIMNFTRNHLTVIPSIFSIIPKDICIYSKRKYKDKNLEHQLVLKYNQYYHTITFVFLIINSKEQYIN